MRSEFISSVTLSQAGRKDVFLTSETIAGLNLSLINPGYSELISDVKELLEKHGYRQAGSEVES